MKLVECVPNFSEGRRPEIVEAIRAAIAAVESVHILDVSSDASHNRSVITFVASVEHAVDAAFAGIAKARDLIDLTVHQGEHPRLGATDVVPFIPLEGATMDDCIALARKLGERVGAELEIPVYLYERAATRPDRENLADVRRGEFEGLRDEIGTNPARDPDFGPKRIHPTAGAIVIGARPFLVAYNVYLGPASNIARREGGREGRARLVRRASLREGARPRSRRSGAGVDEPRGHREDAALPRVRHGEDGSRGARRLADVERDRRTRAGARAVRDRGAPHPASRVLAGSRARAKGARAPCPAA